MLNRWRRLAGAALLTGAGVALLAPTVQPPAVLAHAALLTSSPGSGEVVAEAPDELRLVFSEPLEPRFSALDLSSVDGSRLLTAAGEVDASDPFALITDLPSLPDGVYTVSWRNLSAADGHTTEGFFSFGVGDVEALPVIGSEHGHDDAAIDPLAVAGRFGTYAGLLLALGLPVFRAAVLRRARPGPHFSSLLAACLGLAALASLLTALASAGAAGGSPIDYLFASRNGLLTLLRAGIAGTASGLILMGAPGRPRLTTWVAGVAAVICLAVLAASGHPAAIGPVAVVSQVIHAATGGIWLAGVIGLLVMVLRPRWLIRTRPPAASTLLPRFSALALVAVGLSAATGFFASWAQTGALVDLGTDYGARTAVKLVAVMAALAVGAANFLDGGRRPRWLGGLRVRLGVESALAAAVLLTTATLATTPPDADRTVAIERVPSPLGEVTPGLSLELVPGRPGVNRVIVSADGALGDRPAEVILNRVESGTLTRAPLRYLDTTPHAGTPDPTHVAAGGHGGPAPITGIDRYVADAVVLAADTSWAATVRFGIPAWDELLRQRFAFALDTDSVVEGAVRPPLDLPLLIAGMLAVGGALGLGLGAGGARLPRTESVASRAALLGGGAVGVVLGGAIGLDRLV